MSLSEVQFTKALFEFMSFFIKDYLAINLNDGFVNAKRGFG